MNILHILRELAPEEIGSWEIEYFRKFPFGFGPLRAITNTAIRNQGSFQYLKKEFEAGSFDKDTLAKQYISAILKNYPIGTFAIIQACEQYQLARGEDPILLYFLAAKIVDVGSRDKAIKIFLKSIKAEPFRKITLTKCAEAMAYLGRYEESQNLLRATIFSTHINIQKELVDEAWVNILIEISDFGKARKGLDSIELPHRNSASWHFLYGRLEEACNRHREAAMHFKSAVDLDANSSSYVDNLAKSYNELNEYKKALFVLSKYKANHPFTESLYYRNFDCYFSAGKNMTDSASAVLSEGLGVYPQSAWLHNNYALVLAVAKDTSRAFLELQTAMSLNASVSDWQTWILLRLLRFAGLDKEDSKKTIEPYLEKYKWSNEMWWQLCGWQKNIREKKQLLMSAIDMNPGRAFPFIYLNYVYDGDNAGELEDIFDKQQSRVFGKGGIDDHMTYYEQRVLSITNKAQKAELNENEFQKAIRFNDLYLANGGKEDIYFSQKALLYNAKGISDSAGDFMARAIRFDPNVEWYHNALWATFSHPDRFRLYKKFYDRNPYDAERAEMFIEYNTKWGGGYLVGHRAIDEYEKMFPDKIDNVSGKEDFIYSFFNAHELRFSRGYRYAEELSNSQRYISWYNNARLNAWKGSSKLTFNDSICCVRIDNQDGTSCIYSENPDCGKVSGIRIGDVYINVKYDQFCNPVFIETSDGNLMWIGYDSTAKIRSIKNNKEEEVDIDYAANGKPSQMRMKGVGYLNVSYQEGGDVQTVNAYDEKGKSTGRSVSIHVSAMITQLQELLRKLGSFSTTNMSVPDLGITDSKLDRMDSLVNVKRRFYNSNEKNIPYETAFLNALLGRSKYYYGNTHVKASYADDCAEDAYSIFEIASVSEVEAIKSFGPEGIAVFHKLMLKTREMGLAKAYWQKWIEMNRWLEKEKKAETKLTPLRIKIENLQDTIRLEPVKLLSSSEWLPKSILQNKSLWTIYTSDQFHSDDLGSSFRMQKAFFRRNKELLVGTNKGLFILRKGYWEHMVWNEKEKRLTYFSSNDDITGMSNINAIGETNKGELLLGVNGALIQVTGDYESTNTNVYTDLDGLPDRRILGIEDAPDGSLIVQTASGNCLFKEHAIYPFETFGNRKILFLKKSNRILEDSVVNETIIGTTEDVWSITVKSGLLSANKIVDGAYDDAIVDKKNIFLLKDTKVYRLEEILDKQRISRNIPIELYGNIVTSPIKKVYGLCKLPVTESESAIGVITDLGISLYHENNFEHFDKFNDFVSYRLQPLQAVNYGDEVALICDKDVILFKKNGINSRFSQVKAIEVDEKLAKTFIATTDGLYTEDYAHDSDNFWNEILSGPITVLTKDSHHRVLAGGDGYLYRIEYDSVRQNFLTKQLFTVSN
ncbi:MAG: tetratricopeptide repeat protein [Chitinophagaceae bacterium]